MSDDLLEVERIRGDKAETRLSLLYDALSEVNDQDTVESKARKLDEMVRVARAMGMGSTDENDMRERLNKVWLQENASERTTSSVDHP